MYLFRRLKEPRTVRIVNKDRSKHYIILEQEDIDNKDWLRFLDWEFMFKIDIDATREYNKMLKKKANIKPLKGKKDGK